MYHMVIRTGHFSLYVGHGSTSSHCRKSALNLFHYLAISLIYLEMRISLTVLTVNDLFYCIPDVRNWRRVNAYFPECSQLLI
jgi:hypothetical protein